MNRLIILISLITVFSGCSQKNKQELIIFHAGSLSVPFKQMAQAFENQNPGVNIILEAAGSRACARKISDLNKPCDIMASADYKVIDNLLIPEHASWNIPFASNEMALVYNNNSERANEINTENWLDILLDPNVNYGRSDPNSDPCGYRTVLVAHLADLYYNRPGFSNALLAKDQEHIRPKEVDLLALLETQVIDYVFIYKSVAEQHELNYLILPDSINLKNPEFESYYQKANVKVSGKKPGEFITHQGAPMVYGLTQITDAPNPELAQKFLKFFFIDGIGIQIMEENGQPSVVPGKSKTFHQIPDYLKRCVTKF